MRSESSRAAAEWQSQARQCRLEWHKAREPRRDITLSCPHTTHLPGWRALSAGITGMLRNAASAAEVHSTRSETQKATTPIPYARHAFHPANPRSPSGSEDFGQNQHVPHDRNDAMHPNRAIACRPGKHQHSEYWHQPVGPHQSSYSKDQVQLNNKVEDEVFHRRRMWGNRNSITGAPPSRSRNYESNSIRSLSTYVD